jgi:chaperonin GroES
MNKSRKRLIVTGDRVLISPEEDKIRTEVGLYLPKSVSEKEPVLTGRIVATGPGIPLPEPQDVDDEPWKTSVSRHSRYVPLQAEVDDVAIFLRRAAVEIKYENKTYLVVPQAAILVLLRDDLSDEVIGES